MLNYVCYTSCTSCYMLHCTCVYMYRLNKIISTSTCRLCTSWDRYIKLRSQPEGTSGAIWWTFIESPGDWLLVDLIHGAEFVRYVPKRVFMKKDLQVAQTKASQFQTALRATPPPQVRKWHHQQYSYQVPGTSYAWCRSKIFLRPNLGMPALHQGLQAQPHCLHRHKSSVGLLTHAWANLVLKQSQRKTLSNSHMPSRKQRMSFALRCDAQIVLSALHGQKPARSLTDVSVQ